MRALRSRNGFRREISHGSGVQLHTPLTRGAEDERTAVGEIAITVRLGRPVLDTD